MSNAVTVDDAPFNAFHARVAAYTTGGYFCDGFILGIVGIALAVLTPELHLSSLWIGLLGAAALIGLFLGSLILGPVIDRIGRQKVYTADLALFIVASVAQWWVNGAVALFVLRLIMGIGIGADYALGATFLGEFVPRRHRGWLLSCLNAVWTVGYVVAFVTGYLLKGIGPNAGRWMLVSSAVPAFIVLIMRIGTPESPRWLVSKGRIDEAREIVRRYIHPDADVTDLLADADTPQKTRLREVLSPRWRKRLAFGGLFWFCQVVPYFAIFTFQTQILEAANLTDPFLGGLVLNVFLLAGAILGVWVVHRSGRRPLVIWSFAALLPFLFILGVWTGAPTAVVLICFSVFAFVVSLAADLESTYPSELFPTAIRATGVGTCTAISRIGAAAGTFLLPVGLDHLGVGGSMLIATGVLAVGLVVSVLWAPETKGLPLSEASGVQMPAGRDRRTQQQPAR